MKISDRDKKLILFVLLAAIIALPIFLFIRPKINKTKELEAELVSLNDRYTYLKDLSEKQPQYESEIARLNKERDAMIEGFPGGVLQENTVLFLKEIQDSEDHSVRALTVAFADDEETEVTEASVDANGQYVEGLTAIKSTATIDYCGEYDDVVEMLDYIFKYKDRMILSGITMELDTATNLIKGTVIFDQYAISGTGKEVSSKPTPEMIHGTNRLFDLTYDDDGNVNDYWRSLGVTDFSIDNPEDNEDNNED